MSRSPFLDDAEMFSPPPASTLFPVIFNPNMTLHSISKFDFMPGGSPRAGDRGRLGRQEDEGRRGEGVRGGPGKIFAFHESRLTFVGNSDVQTTAESDARAKAALEAEASAEGAARAVAAACESVAQRLAGDLGHRKVIVKLRKENEALIKAKENFEVSS